MHESLPNAIDYIETPSRYLARTKKFNLGGEITKEIFQFPGGRRFHFREPGGGEFAVWSDR